MDVPTADEALDRSPLHDEHLGLGAKLGPFGGWEMPIAYPDGSLHEHLACRESAAMFDVSHLGTVQLTGPDAFERLQWALTNDLTKIEPGRAQYSHLLDELDGSVLDDVIVWWVDDDTFEVMPNASNTDRVIAAMGGQEVTRSRALVAVQGPAARTRLDQVIPEAADVGRFRVERRLWRGIPCLVAGTGYTGEDGVEISIPADSAASLWQELASVGVVPAGLGARDTLRLEAGLPLHGAELGPGITPLQAGLAWVVAWRKGDFRGRHALEVERASGPARLLRGLSTQGRRPPRRGCEVRVGGALAGVVTSGNFSPVLGHGIAMALIEANVEVGQDVVVDVRGSDLPGRVVPLPFVSST